MSASSRRIAKLEASTEHLRTFGDLAAAYFRATEAGRYRPKRASSLKHEQMVYRVHVERPLADIPIDMFSRRTIKSVLAIAGDAEFQSLGVLVEVGYLPALDGLNILAKCGRELGLGHAKSVTWP